MKIIPKCQIKFEITEKYERLEIGKKFCIKISDFQSKNAKSWQYSNTNKMPIFWQLPI